MSESTPDDPDAKPAKGSKLKLVIVLIAILAVGAGAGFAGYSGLISLDSFTGGQSADHGADPTDDTEFVALPELIIPLRKGTGARHLRAVLHIEVVAGAGERIKMLEPRVLDVLNTFLRAVEERDLESPESFARIQAQMLRRVKLVAGEHDVRDVLVGEFVMQ
jgi:flagellar FliL protein